VKYAPAVDEARGLVAFASFDRSIYILKVATGEKVAGFRSRRPHHARVGKSVAQSARESFDQNDACRCGLAASIK